MPYAWRVKLNGVDISDQVAGFAITASLESFCREMTLDIADADLYAGLDFSRISEAPEIEIFTKTADSFVSQGAFFIERPARSATVDSDRLQSVWGRSVTAALAEPFAIKITQTWETRTTFYAVCEEMCDAAGFTWDGAYCDIDDFTIHPYTYAAENLYPIDVITELAALAGALVTTDSGGHLCIKQIDYAPAGADVTVTDAEITEIIERPEWPRFGNRVRITPTGALASYAVDLYAPDPCLAANGASRAKLYAQVKDPDGEPVGDLAVAWSAEASAAALDYETTNTREILMLENQRSTGFYTVDLDFPPSAINGIWSYADRARDTNLANGCVINGQTVTLAEKLNYCDQSLVISYRAAGMAVNYLTAGDASEDVVVTADVSGQQDRATIYVGNPCQCPPSIRLDVCPSSIYLNQSARALVYVEDSGPVTSGRLVFMSEPTATRRGALGWTRARLGRVGISYEKSSARNEIAGVTQCEIAMFPAAVSAVYLDDGDGNPTGADLYASHDGKVIDLNAAVATGTDLLVSYTAQGAALNLFTGASIGAARLTAYMLTNSEEGAQASAIVNVIDESELTDDYPPGWSQGEEDGAYGGVGGDSEDFGDAPLCNKSSGEKVVCDDDERCCSDGYTVDCRPPEDCVSMTWNTCLPQNVVGDPSEEALARRFTTALGFGCSCAEICENEFDIYDTTQGYDGASGRTIPEIVEQDYGFTEGDSEYWAKYNELKEDALAQCELECEGCAGCQAVSWDEDTSAETIEGTDSVVVAVTGNCTPFTWEVSGSGFSLENEETIGASNLLISDGACGSAVITVTDACGNVATAAVRCTNGQWSDWTNIWSEDDEVPGGCGCVGYPTGETLCEEVVDQYTYWLTGNADEGNSTGTGGCPDGADPCLGLAPDPAPTECIAGYVISTCTTYSNPLGQSHKYSPCPSDLLRREWVCP